MTQHSLPARISDVVGPWAQHSPDHLALVDSSGTWTYRQLADVIAATESWLRESGVRAGDRVMIVGENCRAFAAILLAVARLDAWPVPVNAHLSAREIDIIRDHCGARRIVYTTGASTDAATHAQHHVALASGPSSLGIITLGPLRDDVAPEPLGTDVANRVGALIYTSGTTGLPKGVMLTHRNLLFTAAGAAKLRTLTPDDRLYGVLPLSHVVGLSTNLLGTLLSGATLYLPRRFDPMTARVALEKDRITVMLGVPAMFVQFLRYAKMKRTATLRFPALRIISASGAPLEASVKSAVEALLGLTLHHGYGITECSPNIAQTRVEAPSTDTSVGQPFPDVEIQIVGGDRKPAAEGEVGEVHVRGPNIMKGYYRDPEATAAAVDAQGWFNTRDLGGFQNGRLFLVGRSKDLIIRSGFNVYPVEVEAVLNGHPMVVQSAVISGPVEGDEEIIAFVQPEPDAPLTPRELAEYSAKHLAPYKRPSRILFITTMPLTPTGKIVKGELTKFLASHPAAVTQSA